MSTTAESFTTFRTADILDFLVEAVDAARVSAASNQPWLNAIDAAYDDLLQVDEITFDVAAHAIHIESASEPGRFYIANGDCQCTAFERGIPCRHRAAARLMRRALELRAAAQAVATGLLRARIGRAVAAAQAMAEPTAYRSTPRRSVPPLVEPLGFTPGVAEAERQANYERSLREVNELFAA
jgi:hypothetical protein